MSALYVDNSPRGSYARVSMKNFFRSLNATVLLSIVSGVAVLAIGFAIYLYGQYSFARQQLAKTGTGSPVEIQTLVQTISGFMELPESEVPTLATVSDVAKLPAIPFFAKAKIGDKVLIYQKSAKAILYRPSTKKIIDTSVFTSQESSPTPAISGKPVALTVELRNGTAKTGLTGEFEKKFIRSAPAMRIVGKNATKKRDYADSMVIPKSNQYAGQATELAKLFDIAVGSLPANEASISADILIIVGSDAQ